MALNFTAKFDTPGSIGFFSVNSLEAVFGGDGNDDFFSYARAKTFKDGSYWMLPSVLAGGTGGDQYYVGPNDSVIILDSGSSADHLRIYERLSNVKWFARIDGRHLMTFIQGYNPTWILAVDAFKPSGSIEKTEFSGSNALDTSPVILDTSWESLPSLVASAGIPFEDLTWDQAIKKKYINLSVVGASNDSAGAAILIGELYRNSLLPPNSTLTFAPSSSSVNEGGTLTMTVAATNVSSGTVIYWTVSGVGINSADFLSGALAGSGVIGTDGRFSFSHVLAIDFLKEGDEEFQVKLFADSERTVQVGTTATIAVKDTSLPPVAPTITLAVAPASVAEDGSANLIYTFTRTGPTTSTLAVNYTLGGTATLGTDYTGIAATPATKTVTFAAGSVTAIVTVDPTVDTSVEANETVELTLAAGTGYTVGTTTAVVGTITNDDVALPSITLAVSPASVAEDGSSNLIYTFNRTGPTTSALSVNYTVGGTATLGTDYTGIASAGTTKTVTFAANAATAVVTVDPTVDTTIEADETVALTLAAGTNYSIGTATAVIGTITNDDKPTITLAVAPASVAEDGAANLIYTFSRTGPTTSALNVNYTVVGTATLGTDYTGIGATPATKTVTFAAGGATALVTVDPTADTTVETDETVALALATGTGYTIGTTSAVIGTITNDDVTSSITATLTGSQSSLTLSGSASINGTGNALNNIITGNSGNNILNSVAGNDTLIGGIGLDTLTGGAGTDTFGFTSLNDILIAGTTTARTFEKITDIQIGSDVLDGPGGVRSKKNLAGVTALSDTAIKAVLTTTDFGAGAAATFTYGSGAGIRTFVALNDGIAGFDPSKDGIIEITGFSGSISALNVM